MEARLTRRSVLFGTLALGGCALTSPEQSPSPPLPVQIPTEQAEAALAEAVLAQTISLVSARATELGVQGDLTWLESAHSAHQAYQEQLLLPSPKIGSAKPFALEIPTPTDLDPNLPWDGLLDQLNTLQAKAQAIHLKNALQLLPTDESMAMLYASIAASGVGPVGPPAPGAMDRSVFPHSITRPEAGDSAANLLASVRTLILILETGTGRLPAKDQIRTNAMARLDVMKQLRDDLLTAKELSNPPDRSGLSYHRTAMDTPEQVLQAWISGELALLTDWGRRFVSSDGESAKSSLDALIAQASQVRSLGGALPLWPGW